MPKFKKKPVEVEAVQWNGKNLKEVVEFAAGRVREKNGRVYLEMGALFEVPKTYWFIKEGDNDISALDPERFKSTYTEAK